MRLKSPLVLNVTRTLYLSLGMELSLRVARSLVVGYDINQRMGFPPSVPVPVQDAVNRIVLDLIEADLFIELVEWLVHADRHGYKGKQYPIAGIDEIIKGVEQEGYLLDPESELFYEDPRRQRTSSWGRLKAGVEYPITLLRIDIVNNTRIVRANDAGDVGTAYERFREIFQGIIEKRRGRVWLWEGDGGMAAFQYAHPNMSATLCGMEFMNEMMLYNLYANPLDKPIQLRAAAHAGFLRYSNNAAELLHEELVKETIEIESCYTRPDSFSISASIAPHVDGIIKDCFIPPKEYYSREILSYTIKTRQSAAHGAARCVTKARP
ncbi:MAG: hypothetical protein AB7T74_08330 [Clostridia bacterium]